MNQPGESHTQETIAPAIKKKVILEPYVAHKGFLFYNKRKRATACFLVEYIDKKINDFHQYLESLEGKTEEDRVFLRHLTREQVASLWWERDYNERITTLRKDDEDHFERFIWEYGAYDATLLLSNPYRNKATGYEIVDAIMRDCWECRHKTLSSEKRKKIQEMNPATRAFYDGGDFTYDDDDF